MEQSVIRILSIAPYEGMQKAMESIAEAYPQIQMDVHTGNLDQGAAIVKENEEEDYDVIISRGGTAELIRQVTDIPVVSIQLSVYDVLRAIKMAESYSSLYAVVGFADITGPAHILCDLLRFNIDIVTIRSAADVDAALDRLKQGGYKMVVSDVITHAVARQKGMDAFLITSGAESLRAAVDQAISISERYRQLRRENLFLRNIARDWNGNSIVLSQAGELCYYTKELPGQDQLEILRVRIPEIPPNAPLKFYQGKNSSLYHVTARMVRVGPVRYALFHYRIAQVSLRSVKNGIRTCGESEAAQLFASSFYAVSGALGELESRLASIARTNQPVMIIGEQGTGKVQIARALYLRGPRVREPFVTVDCTLMNDRGWEFLFNHPASPLADAGNTIYFQHLEDLPEGHWQELLAVAEATDVTKHIRLLFSCSCKEGAPLPEPVRRIISRLACLTLYLPTLRSRADEIPSLASLYLSILNVESGKQVTGFDPRATDLLVRYEWPNNYTEFKQILQELVTLTESPYIRGSVLSELLMRNRRIHQSVNHSPAGNLIPQTLEEITRTAILQTLDALGGNQTATAKQLGISRSTLWRHLNTP